MVDTRLKICEGGADHSDFAYIHNIDVLRRSGLPLELNPSKRVISLICEDPVSEPVGIYAQMILRGKFLAIFKCVPEAPVIKTQIQRRQLLHKMINLLAEQHAQAVKLRLPRRQPRPGPLVVELLRVLLVTKKREDSHLSHPYLRVLQALQFRTRRLEHRVLEKGQGLHRPSNRPGLDQVQPGPILYGGDDSDESRSPNRAHHAANQLARLLAQDTAMASPGPRRRNFVPLAHAPESSDSDELPVVIRSRRRALPVPDEDAENPDEIYSLNDTGSDSDEDGSPSAAGSRTQRAAAATHSQGTDTPPLQQEMVIRTSKDNEGFVWMNEESLTALALKKDRSADCKHFYAQREE
ncbi:hypothetical protein R3P38DRAFT_3228385 [Favolaschia claudopus]|uniref:Uncharacterized protein n=1 Tax=Favolaschia claudopus TaxID=2862362 RepID=A0AAV9ZRJ8_9AGAR